MSKSIKSFLAKAFRDRQEINLDGAVEFIFSASRSHDMGFKTLRQDLDYTAPLELPFPNCIFAVENNLPLLTVKDMPELPDEAAMQFCVLHVFEQQPGKYAFAKLLNYKGNRAILTADWDSYRSGSHGFTADGHSAYEIEYSLAHYLCDIVHDSKLAVMERDFKREKRWLNGVRAAYSPAKTIYLGSKGKVAGQLPKSRDGQITRWIESWRVRGHWRRLNSGKLGKDRAGERRVDGFTWVAAHEKGEGKIHEKNYKVTV